MFVSGLWGIGGFSSPHGLWLCLLTNQLWEVINPKPHTLNLPTQVQVGLAVQSANSQRHPRSGRKEARRDDIAASGLGSVT